METVKWSVEEARMANEPNVLQRPKSVRKDWRERIELARAARELGLKRAEERRARARPLKWYE